MIFRMSNDWCIMTGVNASAFMIHHSVEGIFCRRTIQHRIAFLRFGEERRQVELVGKGNKSRYLFLIVLWKSFYSFNFQKWEQRRNLTSPVCSNLLRWKLAIIGKVSMLNSFVNSCSVLHFEQVNLAFAPRCSSLVNLSRQLIKLLGWPFISKDKSNDKSLNGSNVGETCLHVVQTKSLKSSPVKF